VVQLHNQFLFQQVVRILLPKQMNLAVRRSDTHAYVQFGDGEYVCFDLEADPTWRTTTNDDAVIAREARAMLVWRMEHANRQNTGLLVEDGGVGRWPSGVHWRKDAPTA
jgi:hypothetical protein